MEFFLITFSYLISLFLFFFLGILVKEKINFFNIKDKIDILLLGYSIFIILSFHLYFILNISVSYLIIIFLFIIVFLLIINFNFLKKNFKLIVSSIFLFSTFFFIFYIPSIFYGEQFYVFRGNYWDHFNYLSSSILFNKHNYNDLNSFEVISKYNNFQSIGSIIIYRPFINFFQSIYLDLKYLDVYFIAHTFKIFLLFINFLAFVSFLSIFENLKIYLKILVSFVFSVSFFSIYIFEIDALSHLGSISLFLICIKYLHLMFVKEKNTFLQNILLLSLLSSSLFIVYPEIFCVYLIIAFTYLITKKFIEKKKFNLEIISYSFFLFFVFTISSYELNYKFLLIQFNQALNSNIDWWGYFGAFIFGKKSLVLDPNYVETIKYSIQNKNIFDLVYQFYFDHIYNGYNYILLNILPSILGLYFLTIDNSIIKFKYLFIFFILFLNLYVSLILVKNIQYLYNKKKFIVSLNIFIFFVIILYLIINQNFWTVIKIYSYFLVFIFLFTALDLEKQKINRLILVMFCIFPLYKFSSFNYGIGKYDSFPSIIDPKYKQNINWNLDKKKLNGCDIVFSLEKDYFVNRYIEIKSIYNNKFFQTDVFDKNNKKICNVSIIEKSFIVTKIK